MSENIILRSAIRRPSSEPIRTDLKIVKLLQRMDCGSPVNIVIACRLDDRTSIHGKCRPALGLGKTPIKRLTGALFRAKRLQRD
jgi:aspartyl aminopeptidase